MANQTASTVKHGSYANYLVGFLLSLLLTVIPFWMVMQPSFSHSTTVISLIAFAVVQVLVHLYFFLHLNFSAQQRWNLIAFAYTTLLVLFIVLGSIWIMFSLNNNMLS
jgi:cytochrome o ubiquinol oxidase operon protein cyoD